MKRKILSLFLALSLCLCALPVVAGAKSVDQYPLLMSSFNTSGVTERSDGAFFTINATIGGTIQAVTTYHWNKGQGMTPGTISLYTEAGSEATGLGKPGKLIGTWQATGRSGYLNAPNVYWDAFPNVTIPAGRYVLVDSSPTTWSCNSESDWYGFAEIRGTYLCSDWACNEVAGATAFGLLPDRLQTANLRSNITRAEFASVCVNLYTCLSHKSPPSASSPFSDTSDSDVAKAYSLGVVNGVGANRFDPNGLLTREQAAAMLMRTYKKVLYPSWTLDSDGGYPVRYSMPAKFADDGKISLYAKDAVYFMASKSILNGVGSNRFDPTGNASREQAVIIAYRMAQKLG